MIGLDGDAPIADAIRFDRTATGDAGPTVGQVNVDSIPFDEPVGWVVFVIVGLAVLLGPYVLYVGVVKLRQAHRIFANDPVGAGEVGREEGIAEVEGTAGVLDGTLSGKYSGRPAVAQSWRRERKESETTSDGETETSYETVSQGSDAAPFLVEDETGAVAVDPSGADLSIETSEVDPHGGGLVSFGRDDPTYREYEGRIEPGDDVHVYGQVRTDGDGPGDDRHYVGDGSEVEQFVVSDASELRTVLRYAGVGLLLVVVAVLWIPTATVVFLLMVEAAFGIPIPLPIG